MVAPMYKCSMIHCYKLNGFNIALDTASGSVHSVDEAAYDAICMYESAGRDGTFSRIGEKYKDMPDSEIQKLLSDIDDLKRRGKLFATDISIGAIEKARGAPLRALCMNVSHTCNMTCGYCFAGKGGYGGGEELMSLETGRRVIDFLIENSGTQKNLYVDFFGGEPLLNFDVVKGIVAYARKIEQWRGKRFLFTLTTNGLLIDDGVIEFVNSEMDNVVLSIDGRPEINDAMRKLHGGGGSYAEVLPKFRRLVEVRGGKGYYVRGTYTRDNLDFVNDILHLADLGFTELSMEPVVSAPDTPYALDRDCLPKLCEQYELLAREMLKREREGRGFTFYHYMLDLTGGPCLYKRIAGCGVGTEYLAVTPGGELFPCHRFIGNPDFLMGHVIGGVTNGALRGEFERCGIFSRLECRECWARMYCGGGCAASAYDATGSVTGVFDLGCEIFKKRIECAIMMEVAKSTGREEIQG